MDPDLGNSLNIGRVSEHILTHAQYQITDDAGFPAEKIRTRIKVTFLAAVALLSLAAFFFSAAHLARQIRSFNFRPMVETLPDDTPAASCSRRLSSSLPDQ